MQDSLEEGRLGGGELIGLCVISIARQTLTLWLKYLGSNHNLDAPPTSTAASNPRDAAILISYHTNLVFVAVKNNLNK